MEKRKTDLVVTAYIFNQENKLLLIHHKKMNLWLPPGGHIEQNETPDEALLREIDEETGLKVELLNLPNIQPTGSTKKHLAIPFNVNVHSVGDHDHCTLNYLCRTSDSNVEIQKEEIVNYRWVSKEDLSDDSILKEIQQISLNAFTLNNKNV